MIRKQLVGSAVCVLADNFHAPCIFPSIFPAFFPSFLFWQKVMPVFCKSFPYYWFFSMVSVYCIEDPHAIQCTVSFRRKCVGVSDFLMEPLFLCCTSVPWNVHAPMHNLFLVEKSLCVLNYLRISGYFFHVSSLRACSPRLIQRFRRVP